jgi:hypothetical protein
LRGWDERSYNNHGIEQLLGQDTVPRYSASDVELILWVFFLSFSYLLACKALVDAGTKSFGRLLDREEERVLGVFCRHGRSIAEEEEDDLEGRGGEGEQSWTLLFVFLMLGMNV